MQVVSSPSCGCAINTGRRHDGGDGGCTIDIVCARHHHRLHCGGGGCTIDAGVVVSVIIMAAPSTLALLSLGGGGGGGCTINAACRHLHLLMVVVALST